MSSARRSDIGKPTTSVYYSPRYRLANGELTTNPCHPLNFHVEHQYNFFYLHAKLVASAQITLSSRMGQRGYTPAQDCQWSIPQGHRIMSCVLYELREPCYNSTFIFSYFTGRDSTTAERSLKKTSVWAEKKIATEVAPETY